MKQITAIYIKVFKCIISVGHTILAINNNPTEGKYLHDGTEILPFLEDSSNFPVVIKFGRPQPQPNEKIMLASMFHS